MLSWTKPKLADTLAVALHGHNPGVEHRNAPSLEGHLQKQLM
jgi:hypothetical protein